MQIAIIGGGLTGLLTAKFIEANLSDSFANLSIDVFEKSRSIGRLATRYKQPPHDSLNKQWQFAFGAQFFTAKSSEFQTFLSPYIKQGMIESWSAKVFKTDVNSINLFNELTYQPPTTQWHKDQPRYVSSPKMTTFGRQLADELEVATVHFTTRVAPLNPDSKLPNGKTRLFDEESCALGDFDWVICTAPQGQAVELFAQTDFKHQNAIANQRKMLGCYTLMLGWLPDAVPDNLHQIAWDVSEIQSDSKNPYPIGKVFIEHRKPHRDILPSVTVHANNEWSETHLDDDMESVKQALLEAVKPIFAWDDTTAPTHIDCHRWRYASTVANDQITNNQTPTQPYYVDAKQGWIVAGDWCHEGRIESCFVSAKAVAEFVRQCLA